MCLTSEPVENASLSFECIYHIHGGDVGDCITDDILEERLEHTSGLFVDQTRDSLHSSTTGQFIHHGSERQNMEKPERGEIPILPEYGEML